MYASKQKVPEVPGAERHNRDPSFVSFGKYSRSLPVDSDAVESSRGNVKI